MEQVDNHNTNLTLAEFEHNLEAVCAKFPSLTKECDGTIFWLTVLSRRILLFGSPDTFLCFYLAVILLYGHDLYNAVTGGIPAGQVCNAIDLCHNATVPLEAVVRPSLDSAVCDVCSSLVQTIADQPISDMSLGDMQLVLRKHCQSTQSGDCDAVVRLYGLEIINALTAENPTELICANIRLCDN